MSTPTPKAPLTVHLEVFVSPAGKAVVRHVLSRVTSIQQHGCKGRRTPYMVFYGPNNEILLTPFAHEVVLIKPLEEDI